jgi:hypothetical protein
VRIAEREHQAAVAEAHVTAPHGRRDRRVPDVERSGDAERAGVDPRRYSRRVLPQQVENSRFESARIVLVTEPAE